MLLWLLCVTLRPPPPPHSCPLKNNECVTPLDVGVNAHADALLFSFKPQDSSQVESSTKENETVEIVNEKSFGVKYSLIPCSHSLHLFCHLCVSNCESPVAGSCLIKSEAWNCVIILVAGPATRVCVCVCVIEVVIVHLFTRVRCRGILLVSVSEMKLAQIHSHCLSVIKQKK